MSSLSSSPALSSLPFAAVVFGGMFQKDHHRMRNFRSRVPVADPKTRLRRNSHIGSFMAIEVASCPRAKVDPVVQATSVVKGTATIGQAQKKW